MLAPVSEADVEDEKLIAFGRDSLRRYREFTAAVEARSGIRCGYRDEGTLWVAVRHDDLLELERLAATLALKGLAVERLDPAELLRREGHLTGRVVGGLAIPGDHQVDPRALCRALVVALEAAGATLVERARVERLRSVGTGWRVEAGEHGVLAGQVVVATGASSAPPLHPLLAPLGPRPVKGQALLLRAPAGPAQAELIRHVVRAPDVYLVPRADGFVLVGATVEETGFDRRPTAGAAMDLLRSAWLVVPGLYEFEWIESAVGLRPATRDHLPLVGPVEGAPGLFVSTGHYRNGILLAPASAAHLAQAMVEGTPPAALGPFLPARLAAGDPARRVQEDA
jgi:glycine oxidase